MKKKIKLRDLTEEQYKKWYENECGSVVKCNNCPLEKVICLARSKDSWIKNKDLYSDKFLDQEIEIEVPELLTKKEKEYLENFLKPYKHRIFYIKKALNPFGDEYLYLIGNIGAFNSDYSSRGFILPMPGDKEHFKGLELNKKYSLLELGLYKNKKITLTEFLNSGDKLAIHCDTREKAEKFIKQFKIIDKWGNFKNYYKVYEEKTCYCNDYQYGDLEYFIENNYTIYEFEDVDLEK